MSDEGRIRAQMNISCGNSDEFQPNEHLPNSHLD